MKKVLSLILGFLFINILSLSGVYAQNNEDEYKWNLKDIYENEDLWEQDFNWIKNQLPQFKDLQGRLGNSPEELLNVIKKIEAVKIKYEHLRLYSSLSRDLNTENNKYQAMFNRVQNLASEISKATAFFLPELLSLPEQTLWQYVESCDELKIYRQKFSNYLRTKEHTLPKEQEEILALSAPALSVPENTFGILKDADLQYPIVKNEEGAEEENFQITSDSYYSALYSNDRAFRARVYKGLYQPYINFKNTFGSLFNGQITTLIFNAKARKYTSTLSASLDANNIPLTVYDNLIKTVNDNLAPLHRWARLKQKILGLDDLHPYDTYVTLFPSTNKRYTYEEGKALTLKALKIYGQDYLNNIQWAYNHRWVDVYPHKGKRSGAYSSGTSFGVHPYVLLNWNNTLNDVFTLIHEMGHNMHSYYTGQNQPYPYADYSIFVAEVASTANEALLLDYLISKAQTQKEKMALIEQNLNNITFTFYRQTRFAEFEQKVNQLTESGIALTPEKLTELYKNMYQKYWGPSMTVDEEEGYTWARIPHFYYNFYVYQYATSFAASSALVEKMKKEGPSAVNVYINKFLKAGESKYPIDVLKDVGVDMNSPEPVKAVIRKMNSLLDQLEELVNQQAK